MNDQAQLVHQAEEVSSPIVRRALAIVVDSAEGLDEAADMLIGLKRGRKEIEGIFAEPKALQHAAHKATCAAELKVMEPIDEADAYLRDGVAQWHLQEQARIRAEEAEERKRAREEAEVERLRQLEEAIDEGDDEQAEEIIEAPVESFEPAPERVAPAYKAQGVSTQTRWKGECFSLPALLKAVAAGRAPLKLIKVDQSALNAFATSCDGETKVPGIRFVAKVSTVVRG